MVYQGIVHRFIVLILLSASFTCSNSIASSVEKKLDEQRTVQNLKEEIDLFCELRQWQQFHDAKSLSMAIATEAAELMEHFRWLLPDEIEAYMRSAHREDVEFEIADVFWMILCFCNRYNIDLSTVLERKLLKNITRYPVEKAKGNHTKYTEL